MSIEYINKINLEYREIMVNRLGNIDNKECDLEVFKYLHKQIPHYTVDDFGVFSVDKSRAKHRAPARWNHQQL